MSLDNLRRSPDDGRGIRNPERTRWELPPDEGGGRGLDEVALKLTEEVGQGWVRRGEVCAGIERGGVSCWELPTDEGGGRGFDGSYPEFEGGGARVDGVSRKG